MESTNLLVADTVPKMNEVYLGCFPVSYSAVDINC